MLTTPAIIYAQWICPHCGAWHEQDVDMSGFDNLSFGATLKEECENTECGKTVEVVIV